jgi:hypothetical protein
LTSRIVVFLGPTLPRAAAREILEATYLPPAEQGSFVVAVRAHRPQTMILIDGAFGSVPAVRHKEILWALAKGVKVFGAASMGALRAAELSAYGMQGHGTVFRWYSLTPLADDDEVAVAMSPTELGAEPLSEALINIRVTLHRAVRAGVLARPRALRLEEIARATYFVDRSYDRLLVDARRDLSGDARLSIDRLEEWLPANAIDQKRRDAVGLLTAIAQGGGAEAPLAKPPPFRLTETWAYDLDAAGLWADDIAEI